MSKIIWDGDGQKRFETGCDRGVLYVKKSTSVNVSGGNITNSVGTYYHGGVAWNGITSVSKSPSGAEANDIYADNIKYASIRSTETFGATIEAYTYPDEFAECDGSVAVGGGGVFLGQQRRKMFGFTFRTDIGDDSDTGIDYEEKYKLHLIYNATASPSESSFSTINDSPEAITFSWELSTIPASAGSGHLPTACITIDSTKCDSATLKEFEDILYGTNGSAAVGTQGESDYVAAVEATDPMLPMPEDVIAFFSSSH